MNKNVTESWEIFMKLCEEFPELYDKYVEKTEAEMKDYQPVFEITEKQKQRSFQKLWERIRNET